MPTRFACLSLLLAALCGSANASNEQWIEVRSPHFAVVTDGNEKSGRHVVDQFERMRWMFQTLFPKVNVDPVSPIVVVAAKNEKSFQALEPAAYLAKGQMKLSGLFMRTADKNYVLLRLDSEQEHPFSAIYHEYTHLQFSADSQWLPLWLNEGLAEFIQNTEIRNKDVLIGEASTNDILYLRQNRLIPMDVLFKVDSKSPYYHEEQKGSIFYAESWALTHYLNISDRQNHTNKVGEYLALVSRHEDPVAAAVKSFGDLKKLQQDLEAYIRNSSYLNFVLSSAAAPIDESSYKVRTLTSSESDVVRADFLAHVNRVKEARDLLDSILKADPNNAQACETMGFLEYQDGNLEGARKWYRDAVRSGSLNYLAHYNFANLSIGQGTERNEMEIETGLRSSIRLNPRFTLAYDQLASVLMSADRFADAESVLKDWAKVAADQAEAARAQRRIKQLEEIQASRAQAVVDAKSETTSEVVDVIPLHPSESANGPKHEVIGVIREVRCSYPAVIDFRVEAAKKTISLYSNNYYKLDFSVLGFTPEGNLNPCTGIEGMKARVQYAESSDKTVDGQAVAVELRK